MKNTGANRFVSNLSAIDLKRDAQEKLENFVEKVVLLDPRFNPLHGATQENFDEGMRRFRDQFGADYTRANPDAIHDINGAGIGAELKTKYKDVIEAARIVEGDNTKVEANAVNNIVNVMRMIDENFPVPHALPQRIDAAAIGGRPAGAQGKMFNSKEQKLLDSLQEYNDHHRVAVVLPAVQDDISAAFREIKGRVDGGLDNKGVGSTIRPTAAPVAFTAEENAILAALQAHAAGDIGTALKAVGERVKGGLGQHIAGGKVVQKDGTAALTVNEIGIITALENYVPGNIGKALEIMQKRVQGGLNQKIDNAHAASTNAFTAHELKFIDTLGEYGAGIDGQSNVGKGFKQFKSRVDNIDADPAVVIAHAAATPKLEKVTTLTGEEKEAKIEKVLGLLGVLVGAVGGVVPTEAQIQNGLTALTAGALAAGHKGQNQLSDYLNHQKPKLLLGRKQIFDAKDAADGDQKLAIEAIAKLSSDGNPDNGLVELKMVLARKYSDQISLKDSVAAIDKSNPEIVRNHQELRKVKQVKHKEFSDRGIAGRDGLINREIDEVLKDEISSDPRLVALKRELEEQERILSEKQKKLNGTKRHIDELIDNSLEVQVANKCLKEARENLDAFKADWMDRADQSLKADNVGNSLLSTVELAAKQNTEDKERIYAIDKARKAELKNLQDIGVKYDEYNRAAQPDKQRIAGEIDKLVGNENYGDEFSDQMVNAGKAIAIIFDTKGKLDKQNKKSAIVGVVQDFGNDRQLKSRAEKVFGPLARKDAAGRLEDFVDNVEKALEQDLSKTETPKRLQNLLETGSKDSQAFYQTMFHEVVLKKMPAAQMEYFRERAIAEGDITMDNKKPVDAARIDQAKKFIAENMAVVDPAENSVYDLWYKNAKRGGHLKDLSKRDIEKKAEAEAKAPKKKDADRDDAYDRDDAATIIQSNLRAYNARVSSTSELLSENARLRSQLAAGANGGAANFSSPPLSGPSYEQVRDSSKPTSQLKPEELMAIVSRAVEEAFNRRGMFSPMTQGSYMSSAPAVQVYSPGQPLFYKGAGGKFMQLPAQQQAFAPNTFPPQGYGYGQTQMQGSYQQGGGGYYAPQFPPFAPPMQGGAPYYQQQQFYPYHPQMQDGYPSPNMDMNAMKSELKNEIMDNIRGNTGSVDNLASRNASSGLNTSSSGALDSRRETDSGMGNSPERSERVSKRSASASSRSVLEQHEEDGRSESKVLPRKSKAYDSNSFGGVDDIEGVKEYLSSSQAGKNAKGNILIPAICGDNATIRGKSWGKPAEILDNGLVVIKYGDINKFRNHLREAGKDSSGLSLTEKQCLTGNCPQSLISIVEIQEGNKEPSHVVVVSNSKGVRVHNITEKDYEKYILSAPKGPGKNKSENKDELMANFIPQIFDKGEERYALEGKKGEETKKQILKNYGNSLGLPGFPGGRKDRLKKALNDATFVISDRDEIVIERSKENHSRVVVSINGDVSNKSSYISIGHDCFVKISSNGAIDEENICKAKKGGGYTDIPVNDKSELKKAFASDGSDAGSSVRDVLKAREDLDLVVHVHKREKSNDTINTMIKGNVDHGYRLTAAMAPLLIPLAPIALAIPFLNLREQKLAAKGFSDLNKAQSEAAKKGDIGGVFLAVGDAASERLKKLGHGGDGGDAQFAANYTTGLFSGASLLPNVVSAVLTVPNTIRHTAGAVLHKVASVTHVQTGQVVHNPLEGIHAHRSAAKDNGPSN